MYECYNRIASKTKYSPPEDWSQIQCIDMHTGGEPLRVITGGFPEILGNNVLQKRRYVRDHYDGLRKALMWEPRGHADMYGCLLTEPNDEEADFGVIFMHNEGYSTMCGHAVIALGKLAVDMGWVEMNVPETKVLIDAPCGRITIYVSMRNNRAAQVRFHSVPSFVVALDQSVHIKGLDVIAYDIAFGGAFYVYVNADLLGLKLEANNYPEIIRLGKQIKQSVEEKRADIIHPYESDLSFLYGTIFTSDHCLSEMDSRNVCVFADGEVDRSPTGSGVSGRMAIHLARGELKVGQKMHIESIVGSVFAGSIVRELDYGEYKAVIPEVAGEAFITGQHQFFLDPSDPFKGGFLLR